MSKKTFYIVAMLIIAAIGMSMICSCSRSDDPNDDEATVTLPQFEDGGTIGGWEQEGE